MGRFIALLLAAGLGHATAETSAVVKADNTALRSGCADDAPLIASLPANTALKLRYSLSGESVPCYKVAADFEGRQVDGYLHASAMSGLDAFDKSRRKGAWVSTSKALSAARAAAVRASLSAPENARRLAPSIKVILAQAEQLIEANQPSKALEILEQELQKGRGPELLSMAGVAAWRADDTAHALGYWRESLDIAANPALENLYKRVEKERNSDQSGEKLYGVRVVLRYDRAIVPVDTARAMVQAVDSTFARISSQLGCFAEEKIVAIIQSRDAYKKATDAAEWSGGQYDGRIRVPVLEGQHMDARQEQVLAHETTHACMAMLGEWPSWLQEGMAQKLSGETLRPEIRMRLAEMAKAGQLPKLENLRQGWSGLDAQHAVLAYSIALTAVDALFDNFGSDGVRNLMRNPERLAAMSLELDKRLGF